MKQSVLLFSFLTIGFGILYWMLKPSTAQLSSIDSDYDCVIDVNDKEKNTTWLADTSNYKIKDYVDNEGLIDTSKTKKLCDCWEFPNPSDREILKCKDNLNWFTYEGKLIEYRMEGSENGRFYSNSSSIIATQKDNEIEKKHESLFSEHYQNEDDVKINERTVEDLNKLVTISYGDKKYKLKKGFITDKGMDYNNANYRYKNTKWEIQINPPNGPWTNANKNDIQFLLIKVATEIKSGKKKPISEEETEKSGDKKISPIIDDNDGELTSADIYWIQLNNLNDFELKKKEVEILNSEKTMIPTSREGKSAKKNVKTRIKNF